MCDNHDVIVPLDRLMQLSQSNEATAQQLADMVQQLGMYLVQLDTRLRRQEECWAFSAAGSHFSAEDAHWSL